jgi:DNA-directed RNA polymerase specialized sigma24 family protein
MLDTASDVIRNLLRYPDVFDPKTASILFVGKGSRGYGGEPFRAGFISRFEERTELVRRLRRLAPRERDLLLLWYVESRPVTEIAHRLSVSRVHCYRLRNRALREMTQTDSDIARSA